MSVGPTKAYADWAGAALPTEAQWEKAARGTDCRVFPSGNKWYLTQCANWSNSDGKYGDVLGTHPVGSFPAEVSPYGCLDIAGNVWEWCSDWYGANYYKNAPAKNPSGLRTGESRVLRGGSWTSNSPYYFRAAYRNYYFVPEVGRLDSGFRCVSSSPGS